MNNVCLLKKPVNRHSTIQVSLTALFSENGIPVLHCCPKCKSVRIEQRKNLDEWVCIVCKWRGPKYTLKIGYPPYNLVLLNRIIEGARKNKPVLEEAIKSGLVLPPELLQVLGGEA